jgi:hypothetical protein
MGGRLIGSSAPVTIDVANRNPSISADMVNVSVTGMNSPIRAYAGEYPSRGLHMTMELLGGANLTDYAMVEVRWYHDDTYAWTYNTGRHVIANHNNNNMLVWNHFGFRPPWPVSAADAGAYHFTLSISGQVVYTSARLDLYVQDRPAPLPPINANMVSRHMEGGAHQSKPIFAPQDKCTLKT